MTAAMSLHDCVQQGTLFQLSAFRLPGVLTDHTAARAPMDTAAACQSPVAAMWMDVKLTIMHSPAFTCSHLLEAHAALPGMYVTVPSSVRLPHAGVQGCCTPQV